MKQKWNEFWQGADAGRLAHASHSKRRMLRVLAPHLKPGARVLDAGCGSGWFAATFAGMGLDATALDYSPEAVAIAERLGQGKVRCVVEDLLDPKLPERVSDRFDLIFTDGLFEHFSRSDQDTIMANFRRLCAPAGKIATFVPNLLSPWQILRPFLMPGIEEKPFRPPELERLNAGLEILERGGLNVLPIEASPERWLGSNFGMILYAIAAERARSAAA